MAYSKANLARDVLRKLGITGLTDDPSGEDGALVEARYDDKLEELRDQGLCYWSHSTRTSADIPPVVYGAVVNIMCEEIAPHYGKAPPVIGDGSGQPVTSGIKGLRDLRRHVAKGPSGEPTRATYY